MLENKYNKGFTLIEIVAILILIGILMAVAASKYFDMRDEAQKRAALATVAEAQSRINSVFAQRILSGDTCTVARNTAKELENIDDDNDQSRGFDFGDYYLKGEENEDVIDVTVYLISETPERAITTATLYLPECGSQNGNDPTTPTDPIWYWDEEKLRNEFGVLEFSPEGKFFTDLASLLQVIRETANTSGTIFKVTEPIKLGILTLLEPGYYVSTDLGEIQGDLIVGLNAAEQNWVRYDSDEQKWVKYNSVTQQWEQSSPEPGNYYLDSEENAVYIFKGYGDANDPNNWLKFNDTTP